MKELKDIIIDAVGHKEEFDGTDYLEDMMTKQRHLMKVLKVPVWVYMNQQVLRKDDATGKIHGMTNRIKLSLEAMHNELEEIRGWIPWKHWKTYPDDFELDLDEIRLECIDMLHFLLELMICLGMHSDDIHRYYVSKYEENLMRQKRGY